ncbi:MAG TPA: hypothetical protein PL009_11945 [Flavipsychrobacter sp.]|nr:hypothetical protein [Flavipsychrobacter sp.]
MLFSKFKLEDVKQDSLQVEEDISFVRKELVFQRVGWFVMFVVLALGCVGLFGTGILSHRTEATANAKIEYERFLRFDNKTQLIFRINNANSSTTIGIPINYLSKFIVEKITPEPHIQRQTNGSMFYDFHTAGSSEIRMLVKPITTGNYKANIAVNRDVIQLTHFVYP